MASEDRAAMTEDLVTAINRLLDRALRRVGELGDEGDRAFACRLAAEAWALLEHPLPREARRLDGTLHYLTLVAGRAPSRTAGRPG